MKYRIGNGYDVHRFGKKEPDSTIILGGVAIPASAPLIAHSDGDVLIHSLIDALLGALALGDIGKHFPDTDPQYKNIRSLLLLTETHILVQQKGWGITNIDLTVVAQAPKLAPFIGTIISQLEKALKLTTGQISIKATTTEGLGFTGRNEGIAVYAVVLLEQ